MKNVDIVSTLFIRSITLKKGTSLYQLWVTLRYKTFKKDRLCHRITFEMGLLESSCGFKDGYILLLKYLIVTWPISKMRLHLQGAVSHCGLIFILMFINMLQDSF